MLSGCLATAYTKDGFNRTNYFNKDELLCVSTMTCYSNIFFKLNAAVISFCSGALNYESDSFDSQNETKNTWTSSLNQN